MKRLRDRTMEPEWLDVLAPGDPRAVRSRRDLRRVNRIMRNAAIVAAALLERLRRPPSVIVELGAGDAAWLLQLASALPPSWSGLRAILVDRQDSVASSTIAALAERGWAPEVVHADAHDWLERCGGPLEVVVANLFLHHLDDDALRTLFASISARCTVFAACEPRRCALALHASRLLALAGCNAVTRHDAVASVRAGFSGRELTALWPDAARWRVEEGERAPFSHLFVAHRRAEDA